MKFKLTKLNLFLIIITVIVLSTLGFTIHEHFTGTAEDAMDSQKDKRAYEQTRLASLADGKHYDPYNNLGKDPFLDSDYSKTIAGLEEDIIPDRRSRDMAAAKAAGIDLSKYILKSEVVPPVCPKCPDSRSCPRQKPCPPCPPPARCPEPAFECKKVPTHNAASVNGTGPGGTGEVDGGFTDSSLNGNNGNGSNGNGNSSGQYGGAGKQLPMPQLNSFAQFN